MGNGVRNVRYSHSLITIYVRGWEGWSSVSEEGSITLYQMLMLVSFDRFFVWVLGWCVPATEYHKCLSIYVAIWGPQEPALVQVWE